MRLARLCLHLYLRLILLNMDLVDLLPRVLLKNDLVSLLRILLNDDLLTQLGLNLLGQYVSANRTPVACLQPLLYTHSIKSMTAR